MTPTSDDARSAWQRFSRQRVVLLTTLDSDGAFYACPMTLASVTDESTLWFVTSRSTPTARHVERDSRIGATVMQDDGRFVVTVSGVASLLDEPARIRALRSHETDDWYPQGVDASEFVLIEFEIERGEYWDCDQRSMLKLLGPPLFAAQGRG